MVIKGLYGDEAVRRFAPSQQVNIYDAMTREFYCEATIETLPEEVRDDLEGYFFEPTDDDGQPIKLSAAFVREGAAEHRGAQQ